MKTKTLISFAVTAKLICVFVFAFEKSRFSHDEAHIRIAYVCSSAIDQACVHLDDPVSSFISSPEPKAHKVSL